ncbi:MAG: heavy metal translocating P-type ATPase [Bacilli bacterium]
MRYKYKLSNLDCANCANKIECKLKDDSNIENANVNFSKLSLTIETAMDSNIKNYVKKIVQSVEPSVDVLDLSETSKTENNVFFDIGRLVLGIIMSLIGIMVLDGLGATVFVIMGYAILLFRTFKKAIKLLFISKSIDENLLVTISCVGAYLTNNINEGLMVIILYEIGKILEALAVNRSRKSISDLMDIKPEYANLKQKDSFIKVNPNEVNINDVIVIKQGEKVPLDGIVVAGSGKLNVSALTGESKLKVVNIGDEVLSGSINNSGFLELKVTSLYDNSTVARILNLVETATDRKAKTETFVAKAAKVYTPIVLILAILTALVLMLFFNLDLNGAIYRALVFLVISCPCAIAISVPLSYFSGIGAASKKGILIKGSDYLDTLSNVKKIIFDKTGTITTGQFDDYKLEILNKDYTKKQVVDLFVKGEKQSNHPIAKSIINNFNQDVKVNDVMDFHEDPGQGISYRLGKDSVRIGSASYCHIKDLDSFIYLCVNSIAVARLEICDNVKPNVKKTILQLKEMGIVPKMFTGDSKDIALMIADKVGIDDVAYELLPEDKYHLLEREIEEFNGKTAFVGDGINDAPSLALADVGISMGGVGSASAIEASDVVIMTDELDKIVDGIKISRYTNKIIKQNLIFAIGTKVVVLILSALGIASMWQAVFADTGVTLITILNTTRILKK